MLPTIDSVDTLPGPYEILEMRDGEQLQICPESWEFGKMEIRPRDGRPPKQILVIRLHVSKAAKPTIPQYWDVTAQHLAVALLGYLEHGGPPYPTFTITKHGGGARGRHTLEAVPAVR